jgi:hypothetical protein
VKKADWLLLAPVQGAQLGWVMFAAVVTRTLRTTTRLPASVNHMTELLTVRTELWISSESRLAATLLLATPLNQANGPQHALFDTVVIKLVFLGINECLTKSVILIRLWYLADQDTHKNIIPERRLAQSRPQIGTDPGVLEPAKNEYIRKFRDLHAVHSSKRRPYEKERIRYTTERSIAVHHHHYWQIYTKLPGPQG